MTGTLLKASFFALYIHTCAMFCSGKARVDDLESKVKAALAEGAVPFFVSAAGGTTVLGAFDDLHAVADVCEKYSLWMHVDVSEPQPPPPAFLHLLCCTQCCFHSFRLRGAVELWFPRNIVIY